MRCQNCPDKEAALYINGTKSTRPLSGGESHIEAIKLALCEACAEEYRHKEQSGSLFPNEREERFVERVRVMSVMPERTIIRLIRTEADATPEDWSLLTSRLPKCPAGTEMTIRFTPSELEWLKGNRELS
jgi:hypothetical protein